MNTDVLVVDEISMVSRKIFETVEHLCGKLEDVCFGGIPLLLSEDFYQLSPIKDELYGDNGDYLFFNHYMAKNYSYILYSSQLFIDSQKTN